MTPLPKRDGIYSWWWSYTFQPSEHKIMLDVAHRYFYREPRTSLKWPAQRNHLKHTYTPTFIKLHEINHCPVGLYEKSEINNFRNIKRTDIRMLKEMTQSAAGLRLLPCQTSPFRCPKPVSAHLDRHQKQPRDLKPKFLPRTKKSIWL